jgi:hypothetical protein
MTRRQLGCSLPETTAEKTAWANPMTDPDSGVKGVLSELESLLSAASFTFE